ncbi:hypothetical protein BN1051_01990 [Arthrobacter saudimassiliensis]|uniref:Uncharacterized protein n=1 Tax=Arthrobacter saudimassiliensis TaxID=1461584 RepID=A0A078MN11_9MICC|nr:hypothetical protein BN1051_01990 [Arthrobacter saudimassiliensis]
MGRMKRAMAVPGELAAVAWLRLLAAARPKDGERGDVPGWVMVTLMSAVLVVALIAVAQPLLKELFETAIQRVQNAK